MAHSSLLRPQPLLFSPSICLNICPYLSSHRSFLTTVTLPRSRLFDPSSSLLRIRRMLPPPLLPTPFLFNGFLRSSPFSPFPPLLYESLFVFSCGHDPLRSMDEVFGPWRWNTRHPACRIPSQTTRDQLAFPVRFFLSRLRRSEISRLIGYLDGANSWLWLVARGCSIKPDYADHMFMTDLEVLSDRYLKFNIIDTDTRLFEDEEWKNEESFIYFSYGLRIENL